MGGSSIEAEEFYKSVLELLVKEKVPFMIGGTYAVNFYTGINRSTKDIDTYIKAGDLPRMLKMLGSAGFNTEITDAQWIAKVSYGKHYIDFIYNTVNNVCVVDDSWFTYAPTTTLFGIKVKYVPPEELIWIKSFMQDRRRSEGPDVNHVILKTGKKLDWKRLLFRMEPHWEILLANLIVFRFIYPSERENIPAWLIQDLVKRIDQSVHLPVPKEKISRGMLLSRVDYKIDVSEWGYKSGWES